jgi:phospholipase C
MNAKPYAVVDHNPENRAFDHYFGTMAGVRGFSDPNVQLNGATPVWQQEVNASTYLNPWYLNYLGGDWVNATQCMAAGSNGWKQNQLSYNHGANNHWALNNTPWSWGHFKRSDIPVQFAIADGWTTGDMYQVNNRFFFQKDGALLIAPQRNLW